MAFTYKKYTYDIYMSKVYLWHVNIYGEFMIFTGLRAKTLLYGVVAPCGGVNNKVIQLQILEADSLKYIFEVWAY